MNPLAKLLRELHDARGLTVQIVADLAGISASYLQKILTGARARPSRNLLIKLCLIYKRIDPLTVEEVLIAGGYPGISQ